MIAVLSAFVILLVAVYLFKDLKRPSNYPPGPQWLPFVGNHNELVKMSKKFGGLHIALLEWAKLYQTNVLGLKLGGEYVVTVSSYPLVKQVSKVEEYDGRPDNFFTTLRTLGSRNGIIFTDGELWRIHRNFVARNFRNLGFGKKPMEVMVSEEVPEILSMLEEKAPVQQVGKIIAPAVINILWNFMTGSRISRSDPQLDRLLDMLDLRLKAIDIIGGKLNQFPWLRHFAPEWSGFGVIRRLNEELRSLIMNDINEHHKNWFEGRGDDLIYAFISEMKQQNGSNNSTSFTDQQLLVVCLDLFIGSQLLTNTLDFAVLMMILHPEVQKKVHEHLDQNLVRGASVEYSTRHRVPYIEAVLMEVLRYCHVGPIGGPRRVLHRDTILDGYTIPKGATVLINLYSVHNDKSYWTDPETFRPERFLDDGGRLIQKERFFPFHLGKRRCLGEALARNCLFIFFVEIMRKYSVVLKPGTKKPSGVPIPGFSLSPESYRAQFVKR